MVLADAHTRAHTHRAWGTKRDRQTDRDGGGEREARGDGDQEELSHIQGRIIIFEKNEVK